MFSGGREKVHWEQMGQCEQKFSLKAQSQMFNCVLNAPLILHAIPQNDNPENVFKTKKIRIFFYP